MKELSEYILHILHKKQVCNEWIQSKYTEKPIIIFGDTGCGKTCLANYLLRDFTNVCINSDNCQNTPNLTNFLNDSLYKKSITMLFKKKRPYKSLIFDDLDYIRKNDKHLFKSIIQFSKESHRDHPIIYIISSLENKDIKYLYNRCFPIHIQLTKEHIYSIVRDYFVQKKQKPSYIKRLIQQCHSNFHSIQSNLSFHEKKETIQSYEKKETDNIRYYNYIVNECPMNDLFRVSSCDHSIISLNLLENYSKIIDSMDQLSDKEKVNILDKMYSNICLSDYFRQLYLPYYAYGLDELFILLNIIIPITYLRKCNPQLISFMYTKTISKCIIYTYHMKLMNEFSIDYEDLYILFSMIYTKCDINYILDYIQELGITKKVFNKFMKYYESLYKYKLPKQQIKQLRF
jgi:hypothetical protein